MGLDLEKDENEHNLEGYTDVHRKLRPREDLSMVVMEMVREVLQ